MQRIIICIYMIMLACTASAQRVAPILETDSNLVLNKDKTDTNVSIFFGTAADTTSHYIRWNPVNAEYEFSHPLGTVYFGELTSSQYLMLSDGLIYSYTNDHGGFTVNPLHFFHNDDPLNTDDLFHLRQDGSGSILSLLAGTDVVFKVMPNGQVTISPTAALAPLVLGANGQGQLVTGLNADLLDGNEATAFAVSGHNHDAAYLGIAAKAADSDLLDGHDSAYFQVAGAYLTAVPDPIVPVDGAQDVTGALTASGAIEGTALTATTGNVAITAGALTLGGTTRISNAGAGTFASVSCPSYSGSGVIYASSSSATVRSASGSYVLLNSQGAGQILYYARTTSSFCDNADSNAARIVLAHDTGAVDIGKKASGGGGLLINGTERISNTGVGTLTDLTVDDINIDASKIEAATGPLALESDIAADLELRTGLYFKFEDSDNADLVTATIKADTGAGNFGLNGGGVSVNNVERISNGGAVTAAGLTNIGNHVQDTYSITRTFYKASIADNTATSVFRVATVDEPGDNDGGGYALFVRVFVGHNISATASKSAVRTYIGTFGRTVDANTYDAANTAVTPVILTPTGTPDGDVVNIDGVTMSVSNTSAYQQDVQFTVDLSGSGTTTGVVVVEASLIWWGFLSAPVLSQL
jgi:hypothetical protein